MSNPNEVPKEFNLEYEIRMKLNCFAALADSKEFTDCRDIMCKFILDEVKESYTQGYKDALEKVLKELIETFASDHAYMGMAHMKIFITNLLNDK